jgi:hypothetical protein
MFTLGICIFSDYLKNWIIYILYFDTVILGIIQPSIKQGAKDILDDMIISLAYPLLYSVIFSRN